MTLNELEQELAELKEKQDKLTAELERLKTEKSEVKPWRALPGGTYYSINWIGETAMQKDIRGDVSPLQYKCGNYYRTKELAEQDAKDLALRGRVRQLRDALCEGYQFLHDKLNYFVFYCHADGEFQVECCMICQSMAEIYFDTFEHAQKACDILNAEMKRDG